MPRNWAILSLSSLIFATVATLQLVESTPHVHPRQSNESVVAGISWRDENGNVPVRREIRDLKENYPEQWVLYLLGLSSLQWLDQNDPLSYYGLAKIHGRPFGTWGNAPGISSKIGTSGYCPHGNALFLPWHRPYLALFEEELYKRVQHYASTASPSAKDAFQAAANSFRLPYWDWARGESGGPVPEFFTTKTVNVVKPSGEEYELWNPLYSFYFHPLQPELFDDKWSTLNATVRWPDTNAFNAVSNETKMLQSFVEQQRNLHDHIDMAFRKSSFNSFGTTVEEAHGWVHGVIGGGWTGESPPGHMWPLEYSAFEPIFMLHHSNVDRLYAMYQAAHPDRNMESENIGNNGNVFLADGTTVDLDTPLMPFRKPDGGGAFWTPKDVSNTEQFGYAYPETVKNSTTSDAEEEDEDEDKDERDSNGTDLLARSVSASIVKLYSSSARDLLTSIPATAGTCSELVAADGTFTDWSISTSALVHALPSTFVVRFSLVGDFSSDKPVDVGSWVNMMPSSHEETRKPSAMPEQTYDSSVSITSSLLEQINAGKLGCLERSDVVPFLKDRLSWKVVSGDGSTVPQSQLHALRFEVISTQAKIPNDPTKPIEYSEDVIKHPEVTIGKAGGVAA